MVNYYCPDDADDACAAYMLSVHGHTLNGDRTVAHMPPSIKIPHNPTFCALPIFNLTTIGKGSTSRITSLKRFSIASEKYIDGPLIYFPPSTVLFQ